MQKKTRMPKAHMPIGKTARVKFGGKARGRKKTSVRKGAAAKMPFGATKAPGARKSQPAQKKAMGRKMGAKMGGGMKRSRKKKTS